MGQHRLDCLLNPRSIAVIGASEREDSAGGVVMRQMAQAGYKGEIYPINPKRDQINGQKTTPSLAELKATPDLAILAVPNHAIEAELAVMAKKRIPAAIIYSSLVIDEEATPNLPNLMERVRQTLARENILLCGGNGMGFYNFAKQVWACAYPTRPDVRSLIPPLNLAGKKNNANAQALPGNLALITHSGSVFNSLLDADPRLDFSLVISAGQELSLSAADYLDYALDQDHIWTIGLVLETVRDPARFIAALDKAAKLRKAIVILKLGRSDQAAELALSHSGALIGSHGAYQTVFQAFGVSEVTTLPELAAQLLFFSHFYHPPYAPDRVIPPGGLASIHDSGGERVLFVDKAADLGVPFAPLTDATRQKLATRLEPGMLAVNPLDAWGTGRDNYALYSGGAEDLAYDPTVAIMVAVGDRQVGGKIDPWYGRVFSPIQANTDKPLAVISNHQGLGDDDEALRLTQAGIPVWDGIDEFLLAAQALFAFRDFTPVPAPAIPQDLKNLAQNWRKKIAAKPQDSTLLLNEAETLELLSEAGLNANKAFAFSFDPPNRTGLAEALAQARYPVVLKSAVPGLAHKTEQGGVILNIRSQDELTAAAQDLSRRLGPEMLIAPMIKLDHAVEMMLGVTQDNNFGPILIVGFGGIYAETDPDIIRIYPPISAEQAEQRLKSLRRYKMLTGVRGKPPLAIAKFSLMIERLSLLAVALGPGFGDIDINPVMVTKNNAIALDGNVTNCINVLRNN